MNLRGKDVSTALSAVMAIGLALGFTSAAAAADQKRICMSWRDFMQERFKIDEVGIKSEIEKAGDVYVSTNAQADPQKQTSDIETLIAGGCNVLIIQPQDSKTILPSIAAGKAAGIPMIIYDGPADTPDATYISFESNPVGTLMAEGMVKVIKSGNWVDIQGDPNQELVHVWHNAQFAVLKPYIDSGQIKIVASQNITNWRPDLAQAAMEQILTQQHNQVDAVLAMNDSMATGVAAALSAQGLLGIPMSGQDGDVAALNRIAKGQQTVTVWKNSKALGETAGRAAVELADGKPITGVGTYTNTSGFEQPALLLKLVAIDRDNLDLVLDAGWISKEKLCEGVTKNPPKACM